MRSFFPFAALIGVALVLGCQDVGTGVVASDGAGPQFQKPSCRMDQNSSPSCNPPEPTDIFEVKVTGDIFSTNVDGDMGVVYPASGGGPRALDFQLDISSIFDADADAVTCGVGDSSKLPDPLVGNFSFGNFLNDYIVIFFDHNEAQHHFLSPAGAVVGSDELPEPWPPAPGDPPVLIQTTGEWTMHTKGKNHTDGCTGEGVGIKWVAELKNITPI